MTLAAQDHMNLAEAITLQVVDVLKSVEKKSEETKKKVCPGASSNCGFTDYYGQQQMIFYQKLLSDRDRMYSERLKVSSL
jgi:hypothetical protein